VQSVRAADLEETIANTTVKVKEAIDERWDYFDNMMQAQRGLRPAVACKRCRRMFPLGDECLVCTDLMSGIAALSNATETHYEVSVLSFSQANPVCADAADAYEKLRIKNTALEENAIATAVAAATVTGQVVALEQQTAAKVAGLEQQVSNQGHTIIDLDKQNKLKQAEMTFMDDQMTRMTLCHRDLDVKNRQQQVEIEYLHAHIEHLKSMLHDMVAEAPAHI
jgi:tellurite resistance protein